MSEPTYNFIIDSMKTQVETYMTGSLSKNLSKDVVSVSIGQFVPSSSDDKPCVYIRLLRLGSVTDMAGNKTRKRRIILLFSGACSGETQQAVHDDATELVYNLENILVQYPNDTNWSGGSLGPNGRGDDDSPEPYAEIKIDPGQDVFVAHFTLIWSCEVMVGIDGLFA
jgi:hypothetical protein